PPPPPTPPRPLFFIFLLPPPPGPRAPFLGWGAAAPRGPRHVCVFVGGAGSPPPPSTNVSCRAGGRARPLPASAGDVAWPSTRLRRPFLPSKRKLPRELRAPLL